MDPQLSLFAPHITADIIGQALADEALSGGPCRVAAVGPREIPEGIGAECVALGAALARAGHVVISGGASGADRAFIAGAAQVAVANAEIVAPWEAHNRADHPVGVCRRVYAPQRHGRWLDLAAAVHPAWDVCSAGARALHARNSGILLGEETADIAALVVAVVRRRRTGGTEQTLRAAAHLGIPIRIVATI